MKPTYYYKLRQKSTGLYFTTINHYDVCGFGSLEFGRRSATVASCKSDLYWIAYERKAKASLWKKYGYPWDKTEEQCKAMLERLNRSNYEVVRFEEVEIQVMK